MANRKKWYLKVGAEAVKALNSNGFDAQLVETKEEALNTVMSLIPQDDIVGWGGSVTLAECGIIDAVRKNRKVLDRDNSKDAEERAQIMHQTLLSDTFLMSANGIGLDGSLYNIDGIGNRVSALIYGPRQVIVVAGMNKVKKDWQEAKLRARNEAALINMERFPSKKCGCTTTGICVDCNSFDSICNQFVWTRRCSPKGRIKVILVAEELGY